MPDLSYLHDRTLAVVLVEFKDEDALKAGDFSHGFMLVGIAKWRDGHLFVFRGMDIPEFPIPEETFKRIKPVLPQARDLFEGADYSVTLSVGPLPENADRATLISTGLILPRDKK